PNGYVNIGAAPQATFNPFYNLNSAGTLAFNNGGNMNLHQTCFFAGLVISNTPLAAGHYPYSTLRATYPGTFPSGGSGSITVQPYTTNVLPNITQQPVPLTVASGNTANFSITATDPLNGTLTYQWLTNGIAVLDGGNYTGSQTPQFSVANVSAPDAL